MFTSYSIYYQLCFAVLIYLVRFVDKGDCILCYACDTMHSDHCNDPFNLTALVPSDCVNENFACLKREKYDKALNRTYLYRGCIQKHFCEVLAKAADYCFTCTSDYCNNSTSNIPPIYTFLTTALLYIFITK